ncbi:hypothetical protein Bhyg_02968, partial [Pseudolycoriella hygida]
MNKRKKSTVTTTSSKFAKNIGDPNNDLKLSECEILLVNQLKDSFVWMFFGDLVLKSNVSNGAKSNPFADKYIFQYEPASWWHSYKKKIALIRDLVLLCCKDLFPFNLVSGEGLTDFVMKYNIIVSPEDMPCRVSIARSLNEIYEDCKSYVKERIKTDCPEHASLTFDLWSDKHRLTKVKNIVKALRYRTSLFEKLSKDQEALAKEMTRLSEEFLVFVEEEEVDESSSSESSKTLKLDVKTRWHSQLIMIESFICQNRNVINVMLQSIEKGDLILSQTDYALLQELENLSTASRSESERECYLLLGMGRKVEVLPTNKK